MIKIPETIDTIPVSSFEGRVLESGSVGPGSASEAVLDIHPPKDAHIFTGDIGLPEESQAVGVIDITTTSGVFLSAALVRTEMPDGTEDVRLVGFDRDPNTGNLVLTGKELPLYEGNEVAIGNGKDSYILWDNSQINDPMIGSVHTKFVLREGNVHVIGGEQGLTGVVGYHIDGAHDQQLDQTTDLSEENKVHEVFTPTNTVVAEIAEKIGLNPEADLDSVINTVQTQINQVRELIGSQQMFEGLLQNVTNQLDLLTGGSVSAIDQQLLIDLGTYRDSGYHRVLELINDSRALTQLPPDLRMQINSTAGELQGFMYATNTLLEGGVDSMDISRMRACLNSLNQLQYQARLAEQMLDQYNQLLIGFAAADEQYKKEHENLEQSEFRNAQVEAWAAELSSPSLTPERSEEIIKEMKASLLREKNAIEDPNSPRKWFNEAVMRDRVKSRGESSYITGRTQGETKSNQYVAEIMHDMLAGTFDISKGNSPLPIEIRRDPVTLQEVPESGVHRIAALAMLYGNKWQDIAKSKGIEIRVTSRKITPKSPNIG